MLTITGRRLNLENGGIDAGEDGRATSRKRCGAFVREVLTKQRWPDAETSCEHLGMLVALHLARDVPPRDGGAPACVVR
jgi:hypothetical protein